MIQPLTRSRSDRMYGEQNKQFSQLNYRQHRPKLIFGKSLRFLVLPLFSCGIILIYLNIFYVILYLLNKQTFAFYLFYIMIFLIHMT